MLTADMTASKKAGLTNHTPLTWRADRLAELCLVLKQWEVQAKGSNVDSLFCQEPGF